MTYTLGIVPNTQKIQLIKGLRVFYPGMPLLTAKLMADGFCSRQGQMITLTNCATVDDLTRFLKAFNDNGSLHFDISITPNVGS